MGEEGFSFIQCQAPSVTKRKERNIQGWDELFKSTFIIFHLQRTTTTERTTTEPFLTIQTVWDLTYIDFPICLDRVEFEYLNLEWQEAQFTEVFDDPQNRMSFVVSNKQLPCNDEFVFVVKAYGVNGK